MSEYNRSQSKLDVALSRQFPESKELRDDMSELDNSLSERENYGEVEGAQKKLTQSSRFVSDSPIIPESERSIKDLFFLFLLIGIMSSMMYLDYYCIVNGDPAKFIRGYDSWGNVCGKKENIPINGVNLSGMDHGNRTYAMRMGSFELDKQFKGPKPPYICVEECPSKLSSCREILIKNGYQLPANSTGTSLCNSKPDIILKHTSFLNRCFPAQLIKLVKTTEISEAEPNNSESNSFENGNDQFAFASIVRTSLRRLQGDIAFLIIIPIALCFLFAMLLRCFPGIFIVLLIILFGVGSVGLTSFLWITYFSLLNDSSQKDVSTHKISLADPEVLNAVKSLSDETDTKILEVYNLSEKDSYYNIFIRKSQNNPKVLFISALVLTLLTMLMVVSTVAFRKSIHLVVRIFKEATAASFKNPCIFTQPIITFFFLLLVFIHFVFILVQIFSIREPVVDERGFVNFDTNNSTSYLTLLVAHSVSTLFLWELALGCEQYIIAAAVARWYFRQDKNQFYCTSCQTWTPTKYLLKYNLGTICFGAFLLTLIGIIQKLLQYVQAKLKNAESDSWISTLCCFSWYLNLIETVFRFMNRNAYICSAIYGYGYVESAQRAASLLAGNFVFAALLNGISWFFLLLGKFAVVSVTTFCGFMYFRFKLGPDTPVVEYGAVVVLLAFIAYCIARCFFGVYEVVLDTLFICFGDDLERNDGELRPYFASVQMQKTVTKVTKY